MDLELAKQGDTAALGRIIDAHMWLVRHYARRYATRMRRYQIEFDDLVSEGMIGLIDTVFAYEPTRGKFATAARYHLRLRMFEAIRNERFGGTVRRSSLAGRLGGTFPRLWADAATQPDPIGAVVEKVRSITGNAPSREHAAAIIWVAQPTVRIDHVFFDEPGNSNPEIEFARAEEFAAVRAAFDTLDDDERTVVERTVVKEQPLVVGKGKGDHSRRQRERRLRDRALNKLRESIKDLRTMPPACSRHRPPQASSPSRSTTYFEQA